MADKNTGISRKLGPLPLWGWAAAGVGAFLVYRYIKARNAAAAALAAGGTTGGTSIPTGTVQTTGQTTGAAGTFPSVGAWEQAMLTFLTSNAGLKPADAFNAVNSWLNGTCVSQAAYNALSSAIVSSSVGLPPGYSTIPTLNVCPAAAQSKGSGGGPPPAPPPPPPHNAPAIPVYPGIAGLHINMNPGEQVVSTAWDAAANEFIVLTNQGGIYDVAPNGGPGSVFYGSYLGLPSQARQGTRSFVQIVVEPDGTYTAIANDGSTYHFQPGVAQVP